MLNVVALDLVQDARLADEIVRAWADGDAISIIDPRWGADARRAALESIRPTVIRSRAGDLAVDGGEECSPGDAAVVLTSGSMSHPKAAVLSHAAIAASATMTSDALGVDSDRHRWLCCLPCSHIGGLSVITRSIITGTALEVIARPDPSALVDAAHHGVTHVSLVTTALRRIDPSLFEVVLLGGAAPPESLPSNVVATYGMTETGSGVVYQGTPLSGVDLAIAKAGSDGIGEILVRTPTALRTYRDRPAPFVVGPDGGDQWLATGDAGRLDAQGHLEVRGRVAEVIITGGEKVYPGDVESVLAAMVGVAEVAVWKRPDPEWGDRVVAWVVPQGDPPTLADVRSAVTESLAAHAAPKELEIVGSLPRTAVVKIRRQDLS